MSHVEGPLKGEIQEFSTSTIIIGRHPECHLQFPKEVVTLSRKHSQIVREGNRFKLIDTSTNGTFLNGKRVPEAYLKDGDVITFSEGGPKVSFLTQVSDQPSTETQAPQAAPVPQQPPAAAPVPQQAPPVSQPAPQQPALAQPEPQQPAPPQPAAQQPVPQQPAYAAPQPPPQVQTPAPAVQPAPVIPPQTPAPEVQSVNVPFAIQYGPTLKSFQSLPITIGRGAGCDFMVNHPAVNEQQVQIFFSQDQYWIKDLTGANALQVNGMPVAGQAAMQPEMQVALSAQGPKFRFLGGGRLVEMEEPQVQAPAQPTPAAPDEAKKQEESKSAGQKAGSILKKFFSS